MSLSGIPTKSQVTTIVSRYESNRIYLNDVNMVAIDTEADQIPDKSSELRIAEEARRL